MLDGGGSGGRMYEEPDGDPGDLEDQIADADRRAEDRQLRSEVNSRLADLLRTLNDRDVELARGRLDDLAAALQDVGALDRLLLGGSVAKHTYVDGLSDIDSLVVLDRASLRGMSPDEVLRSFEQAIRAAAVGGPVQAITRGDLAVTVTYRDGMEIQLLPAIRVGSKLAIRGEGDRKWIAIDPGAFRQMLTHANSRVGGQLVPAIKLIKSMVAAFPHQKQMTGYHVEAMSIAAARDYTGTASLRDIIPHILERGAALVMGRIRDVTGQSRSVDAYLGQPGSLRRQVVADGLESAARQLRSAATSEEWLSAIGV